MSPPQKLNSVLYRRQFVGGFTGLTLGAIGLGTLAGCAKPAQDNPAEPTKPPSPIGLLAVLPPQVPQTIAGTGWGRQNPAYIHYQPVASRNSSNNSSAGASAGAAVGAALIAAAVIYGIQESRRREREELAAAMKVLNFDPVEILDTKLLDALHARTLKVLPIRDSEIVADLRSGKFDKAPPDVDAVLDVTIADSGFSTSFRRRGYSPHLLVHARVRVRGAAPDVRPDFYEYYADWREDGKNKRWVTTPPSLTFETLDQLKENADVARTGLTNIVETFVALIAQDMATRQAGQLRVD